MTDIFLDIFARRDNVLTRRDARVKLALALLAILAVLLAQRPWLPLTICAATVLATRAAGVPWRLLAMRLMGPVGLALMLVAVQGLLAWFAPIGAPPARPLLPNALQIACRVLAAVSVMMLFSAVTPAHRVFRALRWAGAPQAWVEIATLMYRYTFAFLDLAADMVAAQKVRLGYTGWRRGIASFSAATGTLLIRSMDQAAHTHEAMLLRGYRGDLPGDPLPPATRQDAWFAVAVITTLAGLWALTEVA